MAEKKKILIVDDDVNIAHLIALYLEKEGCETITAARGDDAVEIFEQGGIDMILLDVMLPGMDGNEVLRRCRERSDVPIIMITAKDQTFDKVVGLELGADDYITKPFDMQEMVARVRAVLRRTSPEKPQERRVEYSNLAIDLDTYTVVYNGKEFHLPPKEIELLFFLASNPNRVFTREQLLEAVWGFDFYGASRTVDVHIKRLREKIGSPDDDWAITTIWARGYKFEVK